MTKINYYIIIKTNLYAGNFERNMTAYMTGIVQEFTGVGSHDAEIFEKEERSREIFSNYIEERNSEDLDDVPSPCRVVFDKEGSTTFAIHFSKNPTNELIDILCRRAKAYCEYCKNDYHFKDKTLEVLGMELVENKTIQTKTAIGNW